MAVAAAAALAAAPQGPPEAADLLDAVVALVPRSDVGTGLRRARDLLDHDDTQTVAAVLGCGRRTSAQDTVPFALWSAARSLGDYERAFWATAQAGGDVDTTCAIVGGVVAAAPAGGPPADWLARTEDLPTGYRTAPVAVVPPSAHPIGPRPGRTGRRRLPRPPPDGLSDVMARPGPVPRRPRVPHPPARVRGEGTECRSGCRGRRRAA